MVGRLGWEAVERDFAEGLEGLGQEGKGEEEG